MTISHRILVVDDDFATLDFLRSILELSEGDFEVLGVPSAEEGILALRRTDFHLLVADVRLPGMSGLEMVRKAREQKPGLPVIMITGYESIEAQAEAAELKVVKYFTKPLDAEDFLNSVTEALEGGSTLGFDDITVQQDVPGSLVPLEVSRRLEILRTDTGAQRVVLAAVSGEILSCAGGGVDEVLQKIITATAFSIDSNFHLSDQLGASEPQAIQFLTGEKIDLYCANIGRDYFLAIFFDAQVRRGRIGTVWVFTSRAISNLRSLLVEEQIEQASELESLEGSVFGDVSEVSEPTEDKSESEIKTGNSVDVDRSFEARELLPKSAQTSLVGDSGPSIAPEEDSTKASESDVLEPADKEKQDSETPDLENQDENQAISFEEALERGIISPDFDPD
jgi:DNA-binding response OmpR family regulator